MTTVKDFLGFINSQALANERAEFLVHGKEYLEPVEDILEKDVPAASEFGFNLALYYARNGGFLFGMNWIFALLLHLQCQFGSREWLRQTLMSRDGHFYQAQSNIALARREKFAERTIRLLAEYPMMQNYIQAMASVAGPDKPAFRSGAIFGIEILLAIEEDDAKTTEQQLRMVIN